MRIQKISMQAFGPFKDLVEIDFHKDNIESGLLLITGETGAGKTSIFDGVCYALYGRASGETRERTSLRSDFVSADVNTVVTLNFEHNGHDYEITRGVKMTRRARELKQNEFVEFEINGRKLTGKTEVDNAVKELLSLDFSQFSQVAMLAQGEFSKFLLASAEDKKIIFRKIFNSDNYNAIMSRLSDNARKLGEKRRISQSLLEAAKNKLTDIDYRSMTDRELLEVISDKIKAGSLNVEECRKQRDSLNDIIQKMKTEHDRQEEINRQMIKLENTQAKLQELTEANKDIDEKRELRKYNRTAAAEISVMLKSLSENDRNLAENEKQLQEKQEELRKTEKLLAENRKEFEKLDSYNEDHLRIITKEKDLSDLLAKLKKHRELSANIEAEQKKLAVILDQLTHENAVLKNMEKVFYLGQAYMLSSQLRENEPCPVCGSTEHPHPAKQGPEDVSQKQLDKQRDVVKTIENRRTSCETRIDENRKLINELELTDTADISDSITGTENSIRETRQQLKDLETENTRLTKLKKQLDTDYTALETAIENINTGISRETALKQQNAAELEKIYGRYRTSLEEYEKKHLETDVLEKLEKKISDYDIALRQLSADRKTLSELVAGKQIVDLGESENRLNELNDQWKKADEAYSEAFGRLNTLIRSEKDIRKNSEEYRKIDSEYAVAAEVSAIANGTKAGTQRIDFENYVLSYYLSSVLDQANVRLARMSDNRYTLLRKDSSDKKSDKLGLQFAVYDGMTNKERDVGSLSGGEKFKAALSLALGLSDVISMYAGGIRLDCLFVDEGFGSLDRNSLDQALNTLSELAEGDKLIAIISHVRELEDRIDNKIVVTKTNNGSHINVNP